ncbi:hypothetical protein N7470_001430 [Penicillium chermesinum]|nr:hypothetical protein N7470_001430 [Penicillium chermesinum]
MDPLHLNIAIVAFAVFALVALVLLLSSKRLKVDMDHGVFTYIKFIYANFLKPHDKRAAGQQDALESFYRTQASVYDATRHRLLRGREDMLGLVAAQLKNQVESKKIQSGKAVWVDVGGGTGYNIEAMSAFVPVNKFFDQVYLVDLSPSLCEVARQRFERLGWKNVKVLCQDARSFSLPVRQIDPKSIGSATTDRVDLITMSYSLSMIPDYYSVVDSLTSRLTSNGLLGVCDFYVQNIVDVSCRNYIGGAFNRHVNWLGRIFWRAWFDFDRVNLEAARRDYLEYKFGTVISASDRNYLLGGIPFYIFIGCPKEIESTPSSRDTIEKLDATFTESPYLSPMNHKLERQQAVEQSTREVRSKAYESAVINLSANLPLPSSFYQNHHYRIYYNDMLPKHTQFQNEYIYAFTWEDPRVDHRLLNINSDDVILAITSAGDNILDYLQKGPKRVHAVDLNPNQNHLLELKVASYLAWATVICGRSLAFQYWLQHSHVFTNIKGHGLYETGGSRHAIRMIRYLLNIFGLRSQVDKLCEAQTIAEQRAIWPKIRSILLSKPLNWAIRNMIVDDYFRRNGLTSDMKQNKDVSGQSIWEYVVNTLDPIVKDTLISTDNYFYYLCLRGHFSRRCHPTYLSPQAHVRLSTPGAFDGLRIHTDEINEVINRITPGTLTIAVIMDSMDWFDPEEDAAIAQACRLNHALKKGGRVLLRSASIEPWYIKHFEDNGFSAERVGARFPGTSIDRVNMYASTWICTKIQDVDPTKNGRSMSALSLSDNTTVKRSSSVEDLQI